MLAWGDRWLSNDDGPPAVVIHHDHICTVDVVCTSCGESLYADDLGAMAGPGAGPGPGTKLIGAHMKPR